MLNFWYSDRCTRQIKLLLCIAAFVLLYICNQQQEIPRSTALLSLFVGSAVHLVYLVRTQEKFRRLQAYSIWFYFCLALFLIGLIIWLPEINKALASIQVLAYSLLGFFLISIYSQRSRRHDPHA